MDTKKLSVEDTTGIDATEGLIASVSQGSQPSVDVRVVVEDALERGKELMGVTYTSAMNCELGACIWHSYSTYVYTHAMHALTRPYL